jgi:hypothetical protein
VLLGLARGPVDEFVPCSLGVNTKADRHLGLVGKVQSTNYTYRFGLISIRECIQREPKAA